MNDDALTQEQEEAAARIEDIMKARAKAKIRKMARELASKEDAELFGETEYRIRDMLHELGAEAIDAALEERKKGGIKGPASPAPSVANRPAS